MREPQRLLEADPDSELAEALREARAQNATPEQLDVWQVRVAQGLTSARPDAAAHVQPRAAAGAKAGLLAGGLLLGLAVTALLMRGTARERAGDAARPAAAQRSPQTHELAAMRAPSLTQPSGASPPPPMAEVGPALGSQLATAPALKRRTYRVAPEPRTSAQASDPDAEIALISSAQRALDRDPQHALAQLAEHERRFARGVLAEEREILRVDALTALGRTSEAQAAARAFVLRFPSSPQRPRFERWLATPANVPASHNASTSHIPTE
jgi:hypothetical protein